MAREKIFDPAFQKAFTEAIVKENKFSTMAREKIFDPAFQKAFTEAIIKENKIRALKFLEDASGFPRSARVDFGADYDSDESDQEEGMDKLQKKTGDEYESCSRKAAGNNTNKETFSRTSVSKQAYGYPMDTLSIKKKEREELPPEAQYIFPICAFCDFGWKYNSRNYVVCPRHGPFRRGRFGYSQPIRGYLVDQKRRKARCEKEENCKSSKLSNNVYLG